MSKLLDDLVANDVSLSECLQRLLIIANKTKNKDLIEWCNEELTGYKNKENIPDYRKFKSMNLLYSGINGRYQITNQPLQPGFLCKETLETIEAVDIFDSIFEVEKRKDQKELIYRDFTFLAGEVFNNTKDSLTGIGVQCASIKQVVPQQFYSDIFSAIKVRVINLLCYYEEKGVDVDTLDISIKKETEEEKNKMFANIVLAGDAYISNNKKKVFWNIIIPIITGIVGGIISGVFVYLITNVWMR